MAGQVWSVAADGGYMYSDQLSDRMRTVLLNTVKFRQFCDADDHSDKGLSTGDKFYWNVYSKVAASGGALSENQAIPETKFTITQANGTVTEYGNSVPYTGKLDDLSLHEVSKIIDNVLKIDATEALDSAAHTQFDAAATLLNAAPTGGTSTTAITVSTSTVTITNTIALRKAHVALIHNTMKERNIPAYFENGDYGCIARPAAYGTFETDLEGIHQYVTPGFDMILNGEKGRYRGIRFFEQTNIAKVPADADAHEAWFFGGDTVHEAIVCPEEIRGKIPGDYGRDKGVAWYYMGGFKLVHATSAQARILKWASAA